MLTLALALLSQTTPLNAEAEMAMRCASAVRVPEAGSENASLLTRTAQFSYFVTAAAKADPGGVAYNVRANALTGAAAEMALPSVEEASTLLAECDRLYPLARSAGNATLPADPFDRDLVCYGASLVMTGAVMALVQQGDTRYQDRFKGMYEYYGNRLASVFTERGISGPAIGGEVDRAMKLSLSFGNTESIANSCMGAVRAS